MANIRAPFRIFAFLTFLFTVSVAAQAQTLTWVSGVGDDVNPCSRTAPCKTFAGAISKTNVNGQINVLDSGSFGVVGIVKSVTIDGTGTNATILNSGTVGVSILFDGFTLAGETRKTVRLRNLSINGTDLGASSIRITGAASDGTEVFIEDCVIDGNFAGSGRGIVDERSGGGELTVTNTTIRNMLGTGIVVLPANSGSTRIDVTLDNVRVLNCEFGVVASSGARMSVSNSVISGNTNHGLGVEGPFGAAEMHVSNTRVSGNGTGLLQVAGGTMRVSGSDIINNTANGTAGTVLSYSNNRFAGNGGSSAVTLIGVQSHDSGQQ